MESSLISALPNLGVGVVAVLAIGYIVNKFLIAMDERTQRHEAAMSEREAYLLQVESDIRDTLSANLSNSTRVIEENTRVLVRVIDHLEKK